MLIASIGLGAVTNQIISGRFTGLNKSGTAYHSTMLIASIGLGAVTNQIISGRFTGLNKTLYFCRKMPFSTRFNTEFLPSVFKLLIISIKFEYVTDYNTKNERKKHG
jgi:hypothetical protein